jgi:hypothetical protein
MNLFARRAEFRSFLPKQSFDKAVLKTIIGSWLILNLTNYLLIIGPMAAASCSQAASEIVTINYMP